MIAVLFLFLLLARSGEAEESPGRVLVLPDVTLSAEDPLFLPIPPAAGWLLQAPAQPALVRPRLWAVNAPPRISDLKSLPPLPSSAPRPQVAQADFAPPAPPVPAGPPASPGTADLPGASPPGALSAAPAVTPTIESGFQLLIRPAATAGVDLWLDRRLGSWDIGTNASATLSAEQPESFQARVEAAVQSGAWDSRFLAGAEGALRPQQSGFLSGSISADFNRDARPFALRLTTEVRAEQPEDPEDAWLLASQGISAAWRGLHAGPYLGGRLFAGIGEAIAWNGLARLGLEWAGEKLVLSAGGALLYLQGALRPYPEAALEYRPWRPIALQASLAAYLSPPPGFLERELFGGGERPPLDPESGVTARLAALLDAAESGNIGLFLRASDGSRFLVRRGTLTLQQAPGLEVGGEARWTLLGGARGPLLELTASGFAGLPLPAVEGWGVEAGLRVGFPKLPIELIMQAHWGDVPVDALSELIAQLLAQAAEWQVSLGLRWSLTPKAAVSGGVDLLDPARLEGIVGCMIGSRRSR